MNCETEETMKARSMCSLLAVLALAGGAFAADTAPAGASVTARITDKKGNTAKVAVDAGTTVVSFTSPTGIGDAELKRTATSWGAKILLKFDYDGAKKFTRLEGCVVNIVVGPRDRDRQLVHPNFDEKTGTATITLPAKADSYEVIEISWVDAYR
jgi:hypothetical protein